MRLYKLLAPVAAVFACATAHADGAYAYRAGEAKPTVPYQRAFIAWRGGQETMIVESVLNAPKGDYAWIVPLPAVPAKVEACTPGTLETLSRTATPPLKDVDDKVIGVFGTLLAASILGMLAALGRQKAGKASQLVMFLMVLMVLTVCSPVGPLFFPVFAMPKASGSESVTSYMSGTAGLYRFEVVGSHSTADLLGWLSQNGYALPEKAQPVVKRYVDRGWCFAAMKVHHTSGKPASPNPVRFVFPSKTPIYPMALTGATTERLRVDLFVVADGEAVAKGLEPWLTKPVDDNHIVKEVLPPGKYVGDAHWNPVSHPEIGRHLWKGATLTYLRGDLSAPDLSADIAISLRPAPGEERTKTVYADDSLTALAIVWGMGFASAAAVIGAIWSIFTCLDWKAIGRVLLAAPAIGVVGGGYAGCCSPSHAPAGHREWRGMPLARYHLLKDTLLAQRWAPAGFPRSWLQSTSPHFERDFAELDVPGGYTIEKTSSGWTVRLFDDAAAAEEYKLDTTGHFVDRKAAAEWLRK